MRAGGAGRWDALAALHGRRPADLAVVGGRVVDVHTGAVRDGGVAIVGDRIAATGAVDRLIGDETEVLDADGGFVIPGLIDTHAHQYHSNLSPTEYARLCLRRGTTTVAEAFYGQGQVGGAGAVRFSLGELRATPVGVLFQVPILAYLQNVELGLPATPNAPTEEELLEMLEWGCVGLEEPPYIPFKERDPGIERLAGEALRRGQVIMGHGAGLDDAELIAYAAMGITADHECISAEEALTRIEAGMMVSMRECAIAHDQAEVQRAITEHGADPARFMFSTDVPDAVTMARTGHVDHQIRLATEAGVEPIAALRMATINAARYFRVDEEVGSLAPGRLADVLVVDDLESFAVREVVAKGRRVIAGGAEVRAPAPPIYPQAYLDTVKPKREVRADDLRVPGPGGERATVRVILGAELLSDERLIEVPCLNGSVSSDPAQDVLKIAMVDRYGRSGEPAIGFVQGYALRRGAIGTTYNPYSNNPMAIGTSDQEIAHALNVVAEMGGGFAVVADGKLLASVPLPLFGLMSDRPVDEVVAGMERLHDVVRDLGCGVERPLHQLAFTAVGGELPRLKLSPQGMFDVQERRLLPAVVSRDQ
jgi:adenine deaminase